MSLDNKIAISIGSVCLVFAMVFLPLGIVTLAQDPAQDTSIKADPVLSDLDRARLEAKILRAEQAQARATPKALAEGIAALIQERQVAAQAALEEANALFAALQVDGYTLNIQTLRYEKAGKD